MRFLEIPRRRLVVYLVLFAGLALGSLAWFRQAGPSSQAGRLSLADPARLEKHVRQLVSLPRGSEDAKGLQRTANVLVELWSGAGAKVERQKYHIAGGDTENLITSFGPATGPRLVIGAHYDTCDGLPGADDNGSGTAGITELVFLLTKHAPRLNHRVDLVAYSTEEPPHFATVGMGSLIHAESLKKANVQVALMLSLEMIGYFSDAPKSQEFPVPALSAFYPDVGNYIVVAGDTAGRALANKVTGLMKAASPLGVYAISAPRQVPGIDFSDHRSYWAQGYPALMVTDTAFFRNKNYHTAKDTPEKLDYKKMAEVVNGIYGVITNWK